MREELAHQRLPLWHQRARLQAAGTAGKSCLPSGLPRMGACWRQGRGQSPLGPRAKVREGELGADATRGQNGRFDPSSGTSGGQWPWINAHSETVATLPVTDRAEKACQRVCVCVCGRHRWVSAACVCSARLPHEGEISNAADTNTNTLNGRELHHCYRRSQTQWGHTIHQIFNQLISQECASYGTERLWECKKIHK